MYTLYSMQRSGNSYKVRLALAQLGLPYRLVEIDILQGESRTPEFLAKNPNGQVPLLEAAPGRYLAESNAILWHVASGTQLRPDNRIDRAEALQWMFFEQHSIEPNIGAAYFWLALVKGGRRRGLDRGVVARVAAPDRAAGPRPRPVPLRAGLTRRPGADAIDGRRRRPRPRSGSKCSSPRMPFRRWFQTNGTIAGARSLPRRRRSWIAHRSHRRDGQPIDPQKWFRMIESI